MREFPMHGEHIFHATTYFPSRTSFNLADKSAQNFVHATSGLWNLRFFDLPPRDLPTMFLTSKNKETKKKT